MESLAKVSGICNEKTGKKIFFQFLILNNEHRPFNKAEGPGKNPELINIGSMFIPESRNNVKK